VKRECSGSHQCECERSWFGASIGLRSVIAYTSGLGLRPRPSGLISTRHEILGAAIKKDFER